MLARALLGSVAAKVLLEQHECTREKGKNIILCISRHTLIKPYKVSEIRPANANKTLANKRHNTHTTQTTTSKPNKSNKTTTNKQN
jgi:hypothetical protein